MFCPKCKTEYREGFSKCADCDIDLVEKLPEQTYIDFVSVYKMDNPAILALAKSILQSAGIEYVVKGEGVHAIFGIGSRTGTGFNSPFGHVEIQVV